MMYTPRAEQHLEVLLDYLHSYWERTCPGLEQQQLETAQYSFDTYEGNIQAIFDMLLFYGYSPQIIVLAGYSDGGFDTFRGAEYSKILPEGSHPHLIITTSDFDTQKLYVEVRHPLHGRTELLCDFQEEISDTEDWYLYCG